MEVESFSPGPVHCSNLVFQPDSFDLGCNKELGLAQKLPSENSSERNEKYYKKFDFFYRRTAFRSMTEFYKGLFKPILDKWREGERKSTKNFVQQFICKNANLLGWKHPKKS
jgi:hypothetical protein